MSAYEDALLERWQQGDAAAGSRLLARHRPALKDYFMRRCQRYAEDLTQTATERLIADKDAIRPGYFRAFMYAVARHTMLQHWRDWPRREFVELGTPTKPVCIDPMLPETLDVRARLKRAAQAIDTLPRREQRILKLHIQGKTTAEIARACRIKAPTVRGYLQLARQAMLDESTSTYPARPGHATVKRDDGAFLFVPFGTILQKVAAYFARAQGFATVDDVVDAVTSGRATGDPIPRCGALLQAALRQGRLTVEHGAGAEAS